MAHKEADACAATTLGWGSAAASGAATAPAVRPAPRAPYCSILAPLSNHMAGHKRLPRHQPSAATAHGLLQPRRSLAARHRAPMGQLCVVKSAGSSQAAGGGAAVPPPVPPPARCILALGADGQRFCQMPNSGVKLDSLPLLQEQAKALGESRRCIELEALGHFAAFCRSAHATPRHCSSKRALLPHAKRYSMLNTNHLHCSIRPTLVNTTLQNEWHGCRLDVAARVV